MRNPAAGVRPRRWPIILPFVVVLLLAGTWTGAWFYLADRAQDTLASWRAREADAGEKYGCGSQEIGGFPFRIEVYCSHPSAELARIKPPLSLAATTAHIVWQIYQPTLVIGEFAGPLMLGALGQPSSFDANWQLAQASIHLGAGDVQRVSIVVDQPVMDQVTPSRVEVFMAQHSELHGRPSPASSAGDPAIDLALQLVGASAPTLHPLAARPLDADVTGVLHGTIDGAPRSWPELLRQWQAHGGKLEISRARVQQDEVIAVGAGTLSLTAGGGLDGQMQVTVVGLDKVLKALGIDQVMSQGDVGSIIGALDRIMPGLGQVARQNAGAGIVAGLGAMGQSTQLEGKPAVIVPLRFENGAVELGPLMLGRLPPLF